MNQMTDPRRAAVMAEARSWVGTPFRHQARTKGAGVDCIGLVFGVGIASGVLQFDENKWARYRGYSPQPNPRIMRAAMEDFFIQIEADDATVCDIVWLAWRQDLPMHLALLLEHKGRPTICHAYSGIGKAVEHGFVAEWPKRVHSWWRYPGLSPEFQGQG